MPAGVVSLYEPKTTASKPELARELVNLLTRAVCPRRVHITADAAYRGPAWRRLPGCATLTTRLPRNAVLYAPAPPPTGKRGRPRAKGERLGTPADLAAPAAWHTTTVTRYGITTTVEAARIVCLWYGSLHTTPVAVILIRDPGSDRAYDIALVTTGTTATVEQTIGRYAGRWSIEQAFKDAKGELGAGDAENRLEPAVRRSVPFAMMCQTILVLWYVRAGDTDADITAHRITAPWYRHKTTISLDDMLTAFRRNRINTNTPAHHPPQQNIPDPQACDYTAA
jgi:hypothetical protein